MPQYKRARNLYIPGGKTPFKISRTKIELFLNCNKCFYLDRRFGVSRPSFPAFTLNSAVDALLKKEFDIHRVKKEAHPLMTEYGIDAVPFQHEKMDEWRENFKGVQYLHEPTNFLVFGAVDDIWVTPEGELMVVDYKATSKDEKPNLDGFWQQAYKRQMEVYQWLLRKNGFRVSNTGYFVYVNGRRDNEAFDGKLEFDVDVIPYTGDDSWIETALAGAKKTLENDIVPEPADECEYCEYRKAARDTQMNAKRFQEQKKNTENKETLF
ncbi:MAG: hypothetical protein COW88_00635 [Candidatus Lloydbacteria bacterium CG22_combo_CG10-13_8_21_14_all_47_15]|uniref:PD-(D/E)XK endonuclease-like domain-containing protein n=1 Tax=Candidatus Lloydbacteria bacterium CG22_combo_CG10-13_8_21_14_all_47_15 TaxID=1974635 RepID=A0A2H0CVV9_9BACT|nr:MAG: hypothetical protein COW88_00635 [Candidatus Lloydbacteria bacterium CG22_combo_CG10-13_8_21_14_all_47_15]